VLQGLAIVVAGVAISGSAHAQSFSRWRNASTAHGTFFLGVSGGAQCNRFEECGVVPGTQLITWQKAGDDQQWRLVLPGGGFVDVQDFFPDLATNSGTCMHVRNQSSSAGANLELTSGGFCIFSDNSVRWHLVRAEDIGAPFPGCFAFQNGLSGMFMSVYQGNVQNGSRVVQWPLCQPGSSACGAPAGFHADQFWCPETP